MNTKTIAAIVALLGVFMGFSFGQAVNDIAKYPALSSLDVGDLILVQDVSLNAYRKMTREQLLSELIEAGIVGLDKATYDPNDVAEQLVGENATQVLGNKTYQNANFSGGLTFSSQPDVGTIAEGIGRIHLGINGTSLFDANRILEIRGGPGPQSGGPILDLGPVTSVERDAITAAPSFGMIVANSTTRTFQYWNDTSWVTLGAGGGAMDWSLPVDAQVAPVVGSTYDLGTTVLRFREGHFDELWASRHVVSDGVNTVNLGLDGDRVFHDTDNDAVKDPGEDYIDLRPGVDVQAYDADLDDLADGQLTGTKVQYFTGDSGSGGTGGAVPPPAAGDAAAGKYLAADGGWAVPPGGAGLGTNLVSSTNDILSNIGNIVLGGTGGTNNETIKWDFETTPNTVIATTTSGVTLLDFSAFDMNIDDLTIAADLNAGTLTVDSGTAPAATVEGRFQWDTDDDLLIVGDSVGTVTMARREDNLGVFAATTSAQLRTTLSDESGTGSAVFQGGDVGAATATTPSYGDSDTSVATTAFVHGEIDTSQAGTHASPSTSNPLAPSWFGQTHVVWYGVAGEIDLPAAAGYTGRGIIIYNTGAFTVTVDPNASEVIVRDGNVQTGGVSFTLDSGAGNFVGLISDGARWITLGYKGTLAVGT